MRCAEIFVFILLLSAFSLAESRESAEFLIEHDISTFKFVKSTEGIGLTGQSYIATYKHEIKFREELQQSSTYKVEVELPKFRDPESIFNTSEGALRSTGSINYKVIIGFSDTILWHSGNHLIRISYKHGAYFPAKIITSYNARYPSQAPRPEYVQKFETPKYNRTDDIQYIEGCGILGKRVRGYYCSYAGKYERQRDEGDFCLEGYECRSNKCSDQLCTSPYGFVNKIIIWFTTL